MISIGDLVTWKVDYEENLSKTRIFNSELEVGLVVEFLDPSKNNIKTQNQFFKSGSSEMCCVVWFKDDSENMAWVPRYSLTKF